MKPCMDEVIRSVAAQSGVTEQEVLEEMQKAIDVGFESPDPAVQARWAATPFAEKPTPRELLLYLSASLSDAQGDV